MRREVWLILLAAALLAYLIVLICREARAVRRHKLRVRKLYASPVFEAMLPFLSTARRRRLEQARVDKTGVLFTYLTPPGSSSAFLMKKQGFAYLTPEQQNAMRTLLEECLPYLQDRSMYRVSRRVYRLVNGEKEYSYRYVIQNDYKAMLARSRYDRETAGWAATEPWRGGAGWR